MNAIGRNLLWLLISQLATWVMSLLVIWLVPRYLGAAGLGTYSVAIGYVGLFQLAAGLGTSALMTKEVARDHSIVGPYVFNAVVMKLLIVVVLSALAIGLATLLWDTSETIVLVAVACGGMFFAIMNEIFFSALAGLERMGKSSAWTVASVYVGSIGGVLVLAADGSVVAYAVIMSVATAIPTIANGVMVWPLVREHLHLDRAVWQVLLHAGLPLLLLMVFNHIYGAIDVPILGLIAGETTVGWYALAYRWASIPIFISTAVMASHYPAMSAQGTTQNDEFARLVNRAIQLVLLASIPAAVGLAVVAEDLLDVLYRPEFAPAERPLQILALQIPITAMDTILATALIASDRLRPYLVVAGLAAVLNPIACVIAINLTVDAYDNGAIGAAIVTFATELLVMSGALILRGPGVMDARMISWTLRCTLAGASIVVVGLVAGEAALPLQVLLGVVCYAAASLALGTVRVGMIRDVLRHVLDAVRSIRPRRVVLSSSPLGVVDATEGTDRTVPEVLGHDQAPVDRSDSRD